MIFKEFKAKVSQNYIKVQLNSIFKFNIKIINFNKIQPKGLQFLKYKYL